MTEAAPVYTGVEDLRRIARELLEAGDVRVIIGWEHAPPRRPAGLRQRPGRRPTSSSSTRAACTTS